MVYLSLSHRRPRLNRFSLWFQEGTKYSSKLCPLTTSFCSPAFSSLAILCSCPGHIPSESLSSRTENYFQAHARELRSKRNAKVRFSMRVLGLFQGGDFHSILFKNSPTKYFTGLEKTGFFPRLTMLLSSQTRTSFSFLDSHPSLNRGKSLQQMQSWKGVFQSLKIQTSWLREETKLSINILELRAVGLSPTALVSSSEGTFSPGTIRQWHHSGIQYTNHQGDTRSLAALKEANQILSWTETQYPVISVAHVPGVENE